MRRTLSGLRPRRELSDSPEVSGPKLLMHLAPGARDIDDMGSACGYDVLVCTHNGWAR